MKHIWYFSKIINRTLCIAAAITVAFSVLPLDLVNSSNRSEGLVMPIFSISRVEAAETLRIGLIDEQITAEISCDNDMKLVIDGFSMTLPDGKYFVHVQDGKMVFSDDIKLSGTRAVLSTMGKKPVQVNKRSYYGDIVITNVGEKLTVTNELSIDSYINSVLPAKTMVVWPDAVIKAQTIAARSYSMYMRNHPVSRLYDIHDIDAEFSYFGTNAKVEKGNITKLIDATAGQYLVDSAGNAIKAVTTSSTGGMTESAEQAWGQRYSYLVSVEDDDSDSPEGDWQKQATPLLFEGLLAQRGYDVGKLVSLYVSSMDEPGIDRTATGRVKYIVVHGEKGSAKVPATEIMDMLQLDSTLFDIEIGVPLPDSFNIAIENRYGYQVGSKDIPIKYNDNRNRMSSKWDNQKLFSGVKDEKIIFTGHGKGPGIGLSAWGARALANRGYSEEQILAYYYPGTRLIK